MHVTELNGGECRLTESKKYDCYDIRREKKVIWLSPMTKPLIPTDENAKTKGQHKNATTAMTLGP